MTHTSTLNIYQQSSSFSHPYQDILYAHRPYSHRVRMPVSHRAKQFAPFAALKGFEDSVEQMREIHTEQFQ